MNNNKFNNKKIIKENHCLNKILFRKLRKIKNKLWLLKEIMLLKSMVWKVNQILVRINSMNKNNTFH